MRVYIAGPMTGYPKHNFPAFDAAVVGLAKMGHEPVSPADLDRLIGVTEDSTAEETIPKMGTMIRMDLAAILGTGQSSTSPPFLPCEGMFMLRGWEKSVGARAEHALATWLNLKIMYQE